jgi:SNF2 family DNA or RNA helicase
MNIVFQWLTFYFMFHTAILADEMGLGKTVQVCCPSFVCSFSIFVCKTWLFRERYVACFCFQAITYLTLLNHLHSDSGPHLIVCPASVLENWERELKRWCPSFSVVQYHGATRTAYCKELNSLSKSGLPPPFNVLLVCYSLFERHRFYPLYFCASYMTFFIG